MTGLPNQSLFEKVSSKIRPLNFGGAATSMKFLSPFSAGSGEYEDDTAVPLPSSRFDFIYARSIKNNYSANDLLNFNEFKETHFSKYAVVDALHVSLVPSIPAWSALADIPSECLLNSECKHPTFKYILSHLLGQNKLPDERLLSKMTSYIVDLAIKLPEGDPLDASQIKIEFNNSDKNLGAASKIELFSQGFNTTSDQDNYRHFYFTGTSENSFVNQSIRGANAPFKDALLKIKITAPGHKTRLINLKVRSTYSTYLEINLEKEDN